LLNPSCSDSNVTLFFFFQAEDGIRDDLVTGVQTCALPICHSPAAGHPSPAEEAPPPGRAWNRCQMNGSSVLGCFPWIAMRKRRRSEERRVGKECRSGWERYE